MTLSIIQGDLFDPALNFDYITQGVNCQGVMGAGIAVLFRNKFPLMYKEYVALCKKYASILPGMIQVSSTDLVFGEESLRTIVINMFTQFYMGPNATYENLERSIFLLLQEVEQYKTVRVGLPWIGCGIGGLERHNVLHMFKKYFDDSHVEFVIVQQEPIEEEAPSTP